MAFEGGLDGLGLASEGFRQFVELAGNDMASAWAAGLGSDKLAKGFQAFALTGHHGDDRNAQSLRQSIGIDVVTLIPGDVHHVEGQQGGVSQFDDLGRKVEVALEVGGVDHHDD